MSCCYCCLDELTSGNYSVEHIILNACGGKLKSGNLLCRSYNTDLSRYDASLAKQTNTLAHLLHIRGDRNDPPGIKWKIGATEDEVIIPFEGHMKMAKPKISINKDGQGKDLNSGKR